MSLLNLSKLEKLTIEAFTDVGRSKPANPPSMKVAYNPATFKQTHAITFEAAKRQGLNTPGRPARYVHTPPAQVSFQLILDGTGVDDFGLVAIFSALGGGKSVKKDIAAFKQLCLTMNGETHEPPFLKIHWGDFVFDGRLKTLDITYKLLDESGDPIRVELDVVFVEDKSTELLALSIPKASPDVTHVRVVKSGDTLPLLCKDIYGSSALYLRVAADNGLDNFRNLEPGQKIVFAPLKTDSARSVTGPQGQS